MDILKNKHLVVALLVAPVLALISYFAVDSMVSEKPHAAKSGGSYELISKPNCRYNSGQCGLKNGDFEITLSTQWQDGDRMLLQLKSLFPLEGAMVALVQGDQGDAPPVGMKAVDHEGLRWSLDMPRVDPERHRLRLVVSSEQTLYYGDAATKFTLYKTSFDKDFR
ncbi:hypothetical protein HBA55_11565 [Pseudomaricurvus alkylphenolicus]|uniref:hypothetical protein n=1 Tax=Pseudomaricurvus alkylphenolicus TaxID=1306991 RepID=UPI0014231E5C|nr:hypothetical protein [Pseudomaricurvus alkylphenolicus]NIB40228.1 hypothetical protein [Pseudomaricurvus alkylphenolicus]